MIQQMSIVLDLQSDESEANIETYLQQGWRYVTHIPRHGISHYQRSPLVILELITPDVKNLAYDIDEIKIGDKVLIEFTDGDGKTMETEHIIGILTAYPGEEPYCEIDNKPVDLASEGHSSKMHKLYH